MLPVFRSCPPASSFCVYAAAGDRVGFRIVMPHKRINGRTGSGEVKELRTDQTAKPNPQPPPPFPPPPHTHPSTRMSVCTRGAERGGEGGRRVREILSHLIVHLGCDKKIMKNDERERLIINWGVSSFRQSEVRGYDETVYSVRVHK